ncbi:hypothetical protein IJH29_02310 [Candidatus Saccharibacteria bacterium]|nr:hypothetical protein [Candidatus Saccharibacteria bacterium]
MSNNTNVGTAAPRNQNLGSFMDKLLGRQPIQAPATAQVAPVNSEPPTQPTQAQPAQPAQPVQPAPNASGSAKATSKAQEGNRMSNYPNPGSIDDLRQRHTVAPNRPDEHRGTYKDSAYIEEQILLQAAIDRRLIEALKTPIEKAWKTGERFHTAEEMRSFTGVEPTDETAVYVVVDENRKVVKTVSEREYLIYRRAIEVAESRYTPRHSADTPK